MRLEKLINTVYSFAAAVVIFGAWAKLEHKDYGSIALTAGLLTEVGIFFLYGVMEWGKAPREEDQPKQPQPISTEKAEELTSTLKHTNHILNKVFRTE
ncbi:MAG TPA: hypothetical protein VIM64_13875 [Puia sp.]